MVFKLPLRTWPRHWSLVVQRVDPLVVPSSLHPLGQSSWRMIAQLQMSRYGVPFGDALSTDQTSAFSSKTHRMLSKRSPNALGTLSECSPNARLLSLKQQFMAEQLREGIINEQQRSRAELGKVSKVINYERSPLHN